MGEVLRDYQQKMLERLQRAWMAHRSVMVQMPTGTGKTVLMAQAVSMVCGDGLKQAGEVLIVAHRRELIEQIKGTVALLMPDSNGHVAVESIQKLSRLMSDGRSKMEDVPFSPSLVIIDEAHHALAKTYRLLWERWPEARFLGLTATPCRLNGAPFTDLFDVLLQSWDIQEFINRGWLSDFDYVSAAPDSEALRMVALLDKRGADGDYQQRQLATVMDVPESIRHLYRTYQEFADGKKGIVYAINRQHAQHITEYYQQQGVRCAVIDSQTRAADRTQLVDDYRKGMLDVLVNVDIFGEGFDVPEVEFIQLARPTLSLSKYLQQVGRGMRISEGKAAVLILDNVGLYQTFGLPTEERDWLLTFLGKESGKGERGKARPVVVQENLKEEKTLVNLEMVRIKRHGEQRAGLEIYIQNGKYGFLKDGREICGPEFEKVNRLKAPYFAMGVYPFYIYKNRVDIVDMEGRLMRPGLYGPVKNEGDVFVGTDSAGKMDYWDAKGGRHYRQMPRFERIRRLELAQDGNRIYRRKLMKGWEQPFNENDVYVHKDFIILGRQMMYWNDLDTVYEVCGFEKWCVYVKKAWWYDDSYQYASIDRTGEISAYLNDLPKQLSPKPVNVEGLSLTTLTKLTGMKK